MTDIDCLEQQRPRQMEHIDVMMLVLDRLEYTRRALPRLLDRTCYPDWHLWLVDNGSGSETRQYLEGIAADNRDLVTLIQFAQNVGVSRGTNEVWRRTSGLVAKIDNDILVPHGWLAALKKTLDHFPEVSVIGTWVQSLDPTEINEIAPLIRRNGVGYAAVQHVGGNYLMRRSIIDAMGPVDVHGASVWGFTRWQHRAVAQGWKIGWAWPPVFTENMDLPEHPLSMHNQHKAYRARIGRR